MTVVAVNSLRCRECETCYEAVCFHHAPFFIIYFGFCKTPNEAKSPFYRVYFGSKRDVFGFLYSIAVTTSRSLDARSLD